MFDVGFSELLVIGFVALLAIGPERLPKVARIAGFWVGKINANVASVKADIQQQLHTEDMQQELKRLMANEMDQIERDRKAAALDIEQALSAIVDPHLFND